MMKDKVTDPLISTDFVKFYQWNFRPKQPERPPWFRTWPDKARIAVTIKVMHEWESVPGVQTVSRSQRPMPKRSHYKDDFMALGIREYGARFGIWRLLNILDKHAIKATVITSGLMAYLFPDTVRAAHERGHEIAPHGWDQSKHPTEYKSKSEEERDLVRAMNTIEGVTGERPQGYMSPGPRPTPNTLEICAGLGLVWNGDYCDSDIPYLIDVHGKTLVSLGYVRPAHSDNDIMRQAGVAHGFEELKFDFDAHYEEAERHPMKFCYSVHSHVSGRPGPAKVLDLFLEYVKEKPDIWFCRCIDMAKFWIENETNL